VKALDGLHQNFVWTLVIVAGLNIAAAFVRLFYNRAGAFASKPGQSTNGRS
jgi:cytochrome b561